MREKLILILALTTLAGCTTSSPEAEAVAIVGSQQAVAGCRYIKSVRGDQNMIGGYMLQAAAYHDAINQLKDKTVAAGGNRLYLVNATTGMGGANALGDVYRCPN